MAAAQTSPGKEITWNESGKPSSRVLMGEPTNVPAANVPGGKGGKLTPLYDTGSGQFLGWQTADGQNYRSGSTNGMAPMIYVPKQAGQQPGAQDAGAPGSAQGAGAPGSAGTAPASYLTGSSASAGGPGGSGSINSGASTMANTGFGPTISQDTGPMGGVTPEMARQFFVSAGGPSGVDDATAMAYFAKANPTYGMSGVSDQDAINYFIQRGGASNIDPVTARTYYERAHPEEVQAGVANAALTPEQRALQQISKTDPTSEALRTAVAGSYLTPLQQAGGPQVADYQKYLDMYKQLDPSSYASMGQLGTSMGSYLQQATDQANLGAQLDPVTMRQIEQQTRAGQAARGNVYGTPQLVSEAMTTGQAGLALQQQRQQALGQAAGAMQGYLTSGATPGATAIGLYGQNQANLRNAQQGALSYLGSGQTPYAMGAGYLSAAEQNAAQASQGGPQYNPASLGQSYQASQIPQYGLDTSQNVNQWYNSLSAYMNPGTAQKNKTTSALGGAASGALSGASAGAAAGPYGAIIGGVAGGVLGGAGGYFS